MSDDLYFIDKTPDGPAIFTRVLGEPTPLSTIRVKNLLLDHLRDVSHYSRADPDRSKLEQRRADELVVLLAKIGIDANTLVEP